MEQSFGQHWIQDWWNPYATDLYAKWIAFLGQVPSLQSMTELDEISRVQREIFGVNRVQVGV